MTTRGIQYLKQHHVSYSVVKYDHQEKGAEFAARSVGFPLSRTIKTLVVALDANRYAMALMPGDRQLSMKKIATACDSKKATMADRTAAERLTGYLVGGISPFGTKKRLPTIMDRSLQYPEDVMINAGRRGIMLKMAPKDIVRLLGAQLADLAQ